MRHYYVYILASRSRVVYIGVTSNVEGRVYQHKTKTGSRFTTKYNVNRLVHIEETSGVHAAIAREKQLKGWTRAKKIALIEGMNPNWRDLSEGWFEEPSQ